MSTDGSLDQSAVTLRDLAEAFSDHRFSETYDHLAEVAAWTNVGHPPLLGRKYIVRACEEASAMMARGSMERLRHVVADGGDIVAVDSVTRYVEAGSVSVVASCDIYEGVGDVIWSITSYAVEVADPEAPPA